MNTPMTKIYPTLGIIAVASLMTTAASGAVFQLYDSFDQPGVSGFTNIKQGTNFGTTWGALITPNNPMPGHIAGMRIWSFESGSYSRADASVMLPEPLTGGFRVSFRAINMNYFWVDSGLRKIALRAANPGIDEVTINASSANYQNLLEIISDGTVTGAWNWLNEFPRGTPNVAPPRFVADPGGGTPTPVPALPHKYDLIVNASTTDNFTYVLYGTERTLHPLRIDLFVNGQLVTPAANPNGTVFEDKNNFNPSLGFSTFSFTTATASHAETDFVLDQIYIFSGADVNDGTTPTPTTPAIEVVLADSEPLDIANVYRNELLGTFYAVPESDWIYTRSGWMFVGQADESGYMTWLPPGVLSANGDWIHVNNVAPNWIYVFGSGFFFWQNNGQIESVQG
ncbi:MAG: hypothetical protein LR015_10180 [Verrucomicrobia bacterium]|nr:hypothetical protein [Verrucomicrobiota bacterium]